MILYHPGDPNLMPVGLRDRIAREAVPFPLDPSDAFNTAVDKLLASVGRPVELLGLGEALHGGEDILQLRNRLFMRLVEAHGYTAIAIESSFPRSRAVNEHIAGRGPASFDEVKSTGFSHGFGLLEANRELVEWMRQYNADPSHGAKLSFYGFDGPMEMMYADSPGQVLHFVTDYLASIDGTSGRERRERIDAFLGPDARWEDPAAAMDPARSVGMSPDATALRIETEDLVSELRERRPDLVAKGGEGRYREAAHYASVAHQLLNYHSWMARRSDDRLVRLLGIRDALMADNILYIASQERGRGKVLVFAHNRHLQRGRAQMQLGPHSLTWWPAGAQLEATMGDRYAVIGSAVGVSGANGIERPQAGSLEDMLAATPGPGRFVPTHWRYGLPDIASLPVRSGSAKNPTYFPLSAHSLRDFDWLVMLDTVTYSRGGPPLP